MKCSPVLSLVLALSLLTGCAAVGAVTPQPTGKPTPDPIHAVGIVDLFPAERTAENDEAFSQFALELLRQNRKDGENALLSPLSAALALGMTSAGANGDTAAAFAELFGMDLGILLPYCLALMEDYRDLGGSTQSTLVNSLWCDPELMLKDEFVLTCQEYFDAQLFHMDLQDPVTVEQVNQWAREMTNGLIPSVTDRFDEDAVLALINAIYLKNQFQSPFETPHSDWEMDFTAADGTVTHPKGMHNGTRNEEYVETEDGRGVILPYDDGRLRLLLMLPEEGLSLTDYLANWDGGTIPALLAARQSAKVSLTMPKFKVEWSGSLVESLSAMGLDIAFDPVRANFSSMGTFPDDPGAGLSIGDVIHKTAFEVNEKGTEAAAVTAVIMDKATAIMPPEDLIHLRFDRPFVYAIVDLEQGTPLFLGTLETCG